MLEEKKLEETKEDCVKAWDKFKCNHADCCKSTSAILRAICYLVLTAGFITLKCLGLVSWSWLWVFSPIWIPAAIFLLVLVILIVGGLITVARSEKNNPATEVKEKMEEEKEEKREDKKKEVKVPEVVKKPVRKRNRKPAPKKNKEDNK